MCNHPYAKRSIPNNIKMWDQYIHISKLHAYILFIWARNKSAHFVAYCRKTYKHWRTVLDNLATRQNLEGARVLCVSISSCSTPPTATKHPARLSHISASTRVGQALKRWGATSAICWKSWVTTKVRAGQGQRHWQHPRALASSRGVKYISEFVSHFKQGNCLKPSKSF